jgi:hypothetical protein
VDAAALEQSAELAGCSEAVRAAVRALLLRALVEPALAERVAAVAAVVEGARPASGLFAVVDALDALTLGDDARPLLFLAALAQVPDAAARHQRAGVDAAVSRATLGDLGVWAEHALALTGAPGLTRETFSWLQRTLRGDLLRFGRLMWEPARFAPPVRALRQRRTRALAVVSLAHDNRAIDERGEVQGAPAPAFDPAEWEVALEPGMWLLELHIPKGGTLRPMDLVRSYRVACAHFEAQSGVRYQGGYGEAWVLDPQLPALFAGHPGIAVFQRFARLFPSGLREEKTLRRFFGPDVDRARLRTLPRAGMARMAKILAAFLDDPAAQLRARGGFVLNEEIDARERLGK